MQLEYHEEAKKAGVYIISACGFDSIPAELGVNFIQEIFAPSVLNSVDAFVDFESSNRNSLNHGTWDSAVLHMAHKNQLATLRNKLFCKMYTKPRQEFKYETKTKKFPFKAPHVDRYCIPFFGTDDSCVLRSQLLGFQENNEKPIQFQEYFVLKSVMLLPFLALAGLTLLILSKFEMGRSLLLKYPSFFSFGMFSKTGPSKEEIQNSSFTMTLIGKGWDSSSLSKSSEPTSPPDKTIVGEIKAPNAAYEATSIFLIQSGITILEEAEKMPYSGGVLTPGYAFKNTSLRHRLKRHSISFEIKKMT